MQIYTYDGTFAGLLCCLWAGIQHGTWPDEIGVAARGQRTLFDQEQWITGDEDTAGRCWHYLGQCLSRQSFDIVRHVVLAGTPRREIVLCRYVAFALASGPAVNCYVTDERVFAAQTLARRVGLEAHRLRGLVRFQESADGLSSARIRPDHQVLPLLASYFARRLRGRRWLIHDVKRDQAALSDGHRWEIVKITLTSAPELSPEEKETSALWRRYFQAIAIVERKNLRLQRRFMPQRYWEFLPEVAAEKK